MSQRTQGEGWDSASFLPEDYVAGKAEMRANVLSLILFGVVMFAVVGAFFVTNRRWLGVRQEQQQINTEYSAEAKKIEQLKRLEAQKATMIRKAEVTTALLERVPRSVLLAELITRMPSGITLLELELKSERIKPPRKSHGKGAKGKKKTSTTRKTRVRRVGGGSASPQGVTTGPEDPDLVAPPRLRFTLTLKGVAKENRQVTDWLTALKEVDLIQDVELRLIEQTKIGEHHLRRFEIGAALRPDADARNIAPAKSLSIPDGADVRSAQASEED